MPYITYILYSPSIDKYYIGSSTESIVIRLNKHNSVYYPDKWTKKGIPWQTFFVIDCDSRSQCLRIEAHIKKMKSRIYIEDLVRYPEMILRLKERFSSPDS